MKIYFIGIGGVSMSALAKFLHFKGFIIKGSDKILSENVKSIQKLGIKVNLKPNLNDVESSDLIVVNSAISSENIELKKAKELKIPIYERAELLNEIIKSFKISIGVSGSHGKTTVTSMIAHIFNQANIAFVSHIGGNDSVLSNLHYENNADYFISEICEYKRNIIKTTVTESIILNVDNDHLDCYGNIENLKRDFITFSNNSKIKFINGDDINLKGISGITFGLNNGVQYQAVCLKSNKGKYSFSVLNDGKVLVDINLNVFGKHNVLNALCAFTVAVNNGISVEVCKTALENFNGVERRYEYLYDIKNLKVYADYCHHPTEIKTLIDTVLEVYKNPLFIFEPHTYSRTRLLFNDFKKVLKNYPVLIYKTYPAREKFDVKGSALTLATAINKPYFSKFNYLFNYLINNESRYDVVFILGAGSLYDKFKNKQIK